MNNLFFLFWLYKICGVDNNCIMINIVHKQKTYPILKQNIKLHIKGVNKIEPVKIFSMPSKIKDSDINAMFNGLLNLIKEKFKQEQCEKYLNLKLKYERLKYLYDKLKMQI